MKTPLGTIEIKGLRLKAYHGLNPQESKVGNIFEVDVRLDFDAEGAMRTDRIDLTINYCEIVAIVKNEMSYPSKLLEHVVFNIYNALLLRFPRITGGFISVYKLTPPMRAEVERVGFTFSW